MTTIQVQPAPPPATWHTVIDEQGNRNLSVPFTIKGSQWRLTYLCQGDVAGDTYLFGSVEDPNGLYADALPDLGIFTNDLTCPSPANTVSGNFPSTTLNYSVPGQYLLDMKSNGYFSVSVQDYY